MSLDIAVATQELLDILVSQLFEAFVFDNLQKSFSEEMGPLSFFFVLSMLIVLPLEVKESYQDFLVVLRLNLVTLWNETWTGSAEL